MDQTKSIPASALAKHSLVDKDGYIVGTSILAKTARPRRPASGASKKNHPIIAPTLGKRKVDEVDRQIVAVSAQAPAGKDALERRANKRVRSKHPLMEPNPRNNCLDQNAPKLLTSAVAHAPIPRPIAPGVASDQDSSAPGYPSNPIPIASDYLPNPLPVPQSYDPYAPPFDWFTHSGNRPLDANQDITWTFENGHYHAYRLSTNQQDPYAVPHLVTVEHGLRDIELAKWHLAYLKHQITGNANTKWDDRVPTAPLPKSSIMHPTTVTALLPKPLVQPVPQSTAREPNSLAKPWPGTGKLSESLDKDTAIQKSDSAFTPTVNIGYHSGGIHPSGGHDMPSIAWNQSDKAPNSIGLPDLNCTIEKTRHTNAVLDDPGKEMLDPIPENPRVPIAPHQQAYLFQPEVDYRKEQQEHSSENNNMNRPRSAELHTNSSVPYSFPDRPIFPWKAPELKLSYPATAKHLEAKPTDSTINASPKDSHRQVRPEKCGKAKVNRKPRPGLTDTLNSACELPDTNTGSSNDNPILCTKNGNLRRSAPTKENIAAFMSRATISVELGPEK
ncbi:MAG: hypothetical protein Q9182_001832 [Xanthomendoza sp. 2 TL-2023]